MKQKVLFYYAAAGCFWHQLFCVCTAICNRICTIPKNSCLGFMWLGSIHRRTGVTITFSFVYYLCITLLKISANRQIMHQSSSVILQSPSHLQGVIHFGLKQLLLVCFGLHFIALNLPAFRVGCIPALALSAVPRFGQSEVVDDTLVCFYYPLQIIPGFCSTTTVMMATNYQLLQGGGPVWEFPGRRVSARPFFLPNGRCFFDKVISEVWCEKHVALKSLNLPTMFTDSRHTLIFWSELPSFLSFFFWDVKVQVVIGTPLHQSLLKLYFR